MDLDEDEEEAAVDELSEYLAQPPERGLKEDQLLRWWIGWKDRWPRLYSMAMDVLSIPSMSSENERSFSSAKLVITSQRQRLGPPVINKIVCLKAWHRNGDSLEVWAGAGAGPGPG
jgi:hypothetical protein